MYLFRCEYDDIHKFEWLVLLDYQFNILLEVSCLEQFGFLLPNTIITTSIEDLKNIIVCDSYLNIETKTVESSFNNFNDKEKNYKFSEASVLQQVYLQKFNEKFHTILDQFLYQQLPYYINVHINTLKLITIFDINNYWIKMQQLENSRKYWLLRFKVVISQNNLSENKSENKFKLYNSIKDNVLINFSNLNSYKNMETLHVLINFDKLLKGSVGLLEVLLNWN